MQGIIYCDLTKTVAAEQKISNWLSKLAAETKSELEAVSSDPNPNRKMTLYRQYLAASKSSWKDNVKRALPTINKATFMWPGGYFPFSKMRESKWKKKDDKFVVGFKDDEYLLSGTITYSGF